MQPQLQDPAANLSIDYMSRLLRWAVVEISSADGQRETYRQNLGALLSQNQAPQFADFSFDESATVDGLVQEIRGLAASANDPSELAAYVDVEASLMRALDPEGGAGFAEIYQGGRLGAEKTSSAQWSPINEESLTRYLRTRFPQYPGLQASKVRPLPGGFGKDTILFEIAGEGPFTGPVVMRKDFFVPPGPSSVTEEYALLQALQGNGVPVPTALWSESDAEHFGGCFVVVRRVEGSNDVARWKDSPESCRIFADKLAEILARIHSLRPADIGQSSRRGISKREASLQNMRSYYAHYRSRTQEIHPRIEAAFSWLWNHPLKDNDGEATLVHGDIGFHNLLMQDGQVNAVLDWEFAHIGDPAADLVYCRPFVEQVVPWSSFMQTYVRCGGQAPSQEADRFYNVWGNLRNACMGVGAVGTVTLSPQPDLRSPAAGLGFGPLCEFQALKAIIDSPRV